LTWILWALLAVVTLLLEAVLGSEIGAALGGMLVLASFVLLIAWQLLSLGRLGQTYGKHLVGVRVVSLSDHNPIGSGSAFVRQLVQNVGLWAFGLGWLWALWDAQQQGWHDKVVNCVVVDDDGNRRVDPITHIQAAFRGRW
jgi:uncharacterized RDD family membrane protein YckC